jgi:hemoglobin
MRIVPALMTLAALAGTALAQDPVKVDAKHYKVIYEDANVRVVRANYGPHEKSVMHEHPALTAVFATDAQFKFALPDGSAVQRPGKRGDMIAMAADKHLPENTSDKAAEVILVEYKGAPPASPAPASLYKRLGGYDSIAAVTDDFVPRLVADPALSSFFAGHSADSLKRVRQLAVDFICSATGGPCLYIGRDLKTAHAGLGITEAQWTASTTHFVATLDKFQVPAKEKAELVALVSTLKKDIVEKP